MSFPLPPQKTQPASAIAFYSNVAMRAQGLYRTCIGGQRSFVACQSGGGTDHVNAACLRNVLQIRQLMRSADASMRVQIEASAPATLALSVHCNAPGHGTARPFNV